jgi:hypothetical protein
MNMCMTVRLLSLIDLKGRAQSCQHVAGCGGVPQLSTVFHTLPFFQRRHSFLSPLMASSNNPYRTPEEVSQPFESGYVRVSDQSL